ncbi:hypothetical protein HA466_0029500 [Hirschfeldia incana]|nr:hypothetical protein HA466_0029500 [Hirschfeldia incana]
MAPLLMNVNNVSGKSVYVHMTDGNSFAVGDKESVSVNDDIKAGAYTKLDKGEQDVEGFLLMYDDYNIMINDTLGKHEDVPDNAIHTYWAATYINIDVYHDGIKISSTGSYLGIYQSDGYPKYYTSVLANHAKKGGVVVKGFENVAGERSDAEDEGKGGKSPLTMRAPHANDVEDPTESTSETD